MTISLNTLEPLLGIALSIATNPYAIVPILAFTALNTWGTLQREKAKSPNKPLDIGLVAYTVASNLVVSSMYAAALTTFPITLNLLLYLASAALLQSNYAPYAIPQASSTLTPEQQKFKKELEECDSAFVAAGSIVLAGVLFGFRNGAFPVIALNSLCAILHRYNTKYDTPRFMHILPETVDWVNKFLSAPAANITENLDHYFTR